MSTNPYSVGTYDQSTLFHLQKRLKELEEKKRKIEKQKQIQAIQKTLLCDIDEYLSKEIHSIQSAIDDLADEKKALIHPNEKIENRR